MNGIVNWERLQRHPFSSLQSVLEKAMTDFYKVENLLEKPLFPVELMESVSIRPSIDIVNDKKNFKVEFEIPGMGKDDVKVSIADGMLTIKGEKKISREDKDKDYVIREIHYGKYERNIALPESVDISKAQATFKKGMLWVNIPKKAESAKQCREIKVEEIDKE